MLSYGAEVFKYRAPKDCSLGESGFKNKQFTEEEKQMILEHLRLCLISLIIKKYNLNAETPFFTTQIYKKQNPLLYTMC